MRDLILRGHPYSPVEQRDILEYCAEDVEALERLLPVMLASIDVPYAIFRGRYTNAVARMEVSGIPVDVPILERLGASWATLKEELAIRVESETRWIRPTQGKILRHDTDLKTGASSEPIPLPDALAEALKLWRKETPYPSEEDWVFASPQVSGRSPYWFDSPLRQQIRPPARKAGIDKLIGCHTFRRSLATLFTQKGEGIKIIQELMRYANSRITLDVYAQGDEQAKRAAQEHSNRIYLLHPKAS